MVAKRDVLIELRLGAVKRDKQMIILKENLGP